MGRMAVEPGSAPHWIDDYRGKGRGWRRPYGSYSNYVKDKQKEHSIKDEVKEILLEKFRDSENFTDEQKARIHYTIRYQIGVFSRAIIGQAEELIEDDLEHNMSEYSDALQESRETKKITEMYYMELREKAIEIASEEYDISEQFDIEAATKREKNILDKVESGEITREEAKRLLEKPVLYISSNSRRNQEIMRAYTNFRNRNNQQRNVAREEENRVSGEVSR